MRLTQNRHAALDERYRAFLLEVGEGRVPYDMDVGPCSIALPPPMSLPAVAQPEDLIQFVCDDILPETRACVEVPNDNNIRRLASRYIRRGFSILPGRVPPILPGLPPSTLRLCSGALVMLLRNLDYEDGLCYGTR